MIVTFSYGHNPLIITLAFLPFVIGQIIPSNILYPLYLNLMPEEKGRLTALIQGGRLIFASIGLQIARYFYDGWHYCGGFCFCRNYYDVICAQALGLSLPNNVYK
jgi:hypothetical protein